MLPLHVLLLENFKDRIKKLIDSSLSHFNHWIAHEQFDDIVPDYILDVCQKGHNYVLLAKKCLENALLSYHEAPIYTIHSFCYRMLCENAFEGDLGLSFSYEDSV